MKEHAEMVTRLVKSGVRIMQSLSSDKIDLWHAATGVSTESGELLDQVKRHVIYEKPLDLENIVEELGDLEFYIEQVRQRTGVTREQCLAYNMKKLADKDTGRYAKGYTDAAAIARADKQKKEGVQEDIRSGHVNEEG